MEKKELEALVKQLEQERNHFAHQLDILQKTALHAIITIEKTFRPLIVQRELVNEKCNEQAIQWDRAIEHAIRRLVRITHPEAITREQVEAFFGEFLPQTGDLMQLDARLEQESAAQRIDGECCLLSALKHLVEVARLSLERNDTCSCAELEGVQCLVCDTNEALDYGEYWLRILDNECEDPSFAPQQNST